MFYVASLLIDVGMYILTIIARNTLDVPYF